MLAEFSGFSGPLAPPLRAGRPSDHRAVLATFTLPAVTGPDIPENPPSGLPICESADFSGAMLALPGP